MHTVRFIRFFWYTYPYSWHIHIYMYVAYWRYWPRRCQSYSWFVDVVFVRVVVLLHLWICSSREPRVIGVVVSFSNITSPFRFSWVSLRLLFSVIWIFGRYSFWKRGGMGDTESCSSTATESASTKRRMRRQKFDVYEDICQRLRASENEEASQPGFEDELWNHFNRFSSRYSLALPL